MAVSPIESDIEFEVEEFLGSQYFKGQMHHFVDGCQWSLAEALWTSSIIEALALVRPNGVILDGAIDAGNPGNSGSAHFPSRLFQSL